MKPASAAQDWERQDRIKRLLADALEVASSSREAFIDRAASDDPSVVHEVRALIGAHERAVRFLEDPTLNGSDPAGAAIGQTIGRYTLQRLIGEGGFGCVYLAEQREPVTRTVALKIIKPGMDTRQVIARFEAERQTLAMMKHPGIAAVFDAGATQEGRPYFVMEFVDGISITDYCDQHCLSLEQRLGLFTQVCSAVQHAHTKGVIHRDLKPSNLLVSMHDGLALPKVIDFGIAKATTGRLTDVTISADSRGFIGTPQYMSPEQADENAIDIDTRSDVYSLGVVLYELLAGVAPFDDGQLRSAGSSWRRIIREENPPKPSTRLSSLHTLTSVAARRGIGANRLPPRVSGDLDWITLKSMDKDRDRRYSSAAELAEDIHRHLRHEPVLASPPSRTYLFRKFVRRHRVGMLASCLIALAIGCGSVGLTIGMMQARQSAREASDSAQQARDINAFMREILTSVKPEQDGADVRLVEVMDNASTAASQRFADYPLLEAEVRDLLGSVYSDLSMWNKSGREHKRATELWLKWAGADDPRTISSERMYVGCAINNRQIGEIAPRLPDLLARTQHVFGPNDLATLDVERSIGRVQMLQGHTVEAERTFLDVRAQLLAHGDDDALHIRTLKDLIDLGRARAHDPQNPASLHKVMLSQVEVLARERVDRAIRAYGADSMIAIDAQIGLAQLLADQGEYQAAAQSCRAILDIASPRLGECHHIRMEAIEVLAFVAHRLGDSSTAADLNLTEIACVRQLGAPIMLVSAIGDALPVLDRGNRWVEGEALAREYAKQLSEFGGGHGDLGFDADLWVARFVSLQDRLDEAELMFQALLARTDPVEGEVRARLHLFRGSNLCRLGAFEESEAEIQIAANGLKDFRRGTHITNPDDVLLEFIALYTAWGKPEKAAEYETMREEMLENLPVGPS